MLKLVLDLLFPPVCASCKQEGAFLCIKCRSELKIRHLRSKSVFPSKSDFLNLDGVIYAADYAENHGLMAAIKQFKYKYTRDLADDFSDLLNEKLNELNMMRGSKGILIPVPLHKKRQAERGFNQAELLAESIINKNSSLELISLLKRVKNTAQQAKLNKKQRHKNLKDAFVINNQMNRNDGKICFLVDDVCTTGATLDACAKTLKTAGMKRVYGLVIARAFK